MADYAWMLAATTDPGYRDPHRAIELANELIQNSPKVRDVWTTLGVAHYRAGAWNDAIAALEKSEAAAPGLFTAANGFFLAMAYWRLGEKEKGRAVVREGLTVGGDSQSADRARTRALSIGGSPLAGHRGPGAAAYRALLGPSAAWFSINTGGLRCFVACSYAKAQPSKSPSFHGRAENSSPNGNPVG